MSTAAELLQSSSSQFPSYKAPSEHGGALCEPPVREWNNLLQRNVHLRGEFALEWCGIPHHQAASQARHELLRQSILHTSTYADVSETVDIDDARPIIMGGHQPELFHPGVWFKNFLLASAARAHKATAVNLLVDHDLCRSLAIRVPTLDQRGQLMLENIAIESHRRAIPWELRQASDMASWRTFPERVLASLQQAVPTYSDGDPIILSEIWPQAIQSLEKGMPIGHALASARHAWELRNGSQTLEVPLSFICKQRTFARFVLQLLTELPRFVAIYNECRQVFRSHHRIRSQAHPVPALQIEGDWHETPFWIYSAHSPERRGLFARYRDGQFELSDLQQWSATLCARTERDQCLSQWQKLVEAGICIRPRALTTTMFARLFLSDLFLHGIGGGKYDQLTDLILKRWLDIEPPAFTVATATLRLPWQTELEQGPTVNQLRSQLRASRYHAEDFLSKQVAGEATVLNALLERKLLLLDKIPPRGAKQSWHLAMKDVNAQLEAFLAESQQRWRGQIEPAEQMQRRRKWMLARDYSLVLFPSSTLGHQLRNLARQPS